MNRHGQWGRQVLVGDSRIRSLVCCMGRMSLAREQRRARGYCLTQSTCQNLVFSGDDFVCKYFQVFRKYLIG
jgi:hypothetical protein